MNLNSDLINDITVHELVTKIGSCTIVMYTYYSNYMNYISNTIKSVPIPSELQKKKT